MAMEPITLFSRIADPAGVVRRLRETGAAVQADGPDDRWRNAAATFGRWWKKRTLTLTHDPEYHREPNWSTQMDGMRGYFSRFPETERKETALLLPTTFRWSLVTRFDPEPDPAGDPRLDALFAVAELLDGVLFTPSALLDARGRVLFSAAGAAAEDPHAAWPRVVAQVPVPDPREAGREAGDGTSEDDEGDEDFAPPEAARVARRALALAAVTARAILEGNAGRRGTAGTYRNLQGWVRDVGIEDEMEEDELELLRTPLGQLDPRAQTDAGWRLEGLAVLAWALGRFKLPPHDVLVVPDELWAALGLLDAKVARVQLAAPRLRPPEEIRALRDRLFALHWRLRDFTLRPAAMDFAEFARTAWFGPLDLTGLPLVGGDLALRGARLDQAPPDALSMALGTARERHQAASWLMEGPELYSDASTDT